MLAMVVDALTDRGVTPAASYKVPGETCERLGVPACASPCDPRESVRQPVHGLF